MPTARESTELFWALGNVYNNKLTLSQKNDTILVKIPAVEHVLEVHVVPFAKVSKALQLEEARETIDFTIDKIAHTLLLLKASSSAPWNSTLTPSEPGEEVLAQLQNGKIEQCAYIGEGKWKTTRYSGYTLYTTNWVAGWLPCPKEIRMTSEERMGIDV